MSDADTSTNPTTDATQTPASDTSDATTPNASSPDASTGTDAGTGTAAPNVPDTTIPSAHSTVSDDDEKKSLTSSGAATEAGDEGNASSAAPTFGDATSSETGALSQGSANQAASTPSSDSDLGKSSASDEAGQDSASAPTATGDAPAASMDAAQDAPTDTSVPSNTSASVAASDDKANVSAVSDGEADDAGKPTPDPLMAGDLGSAPAPSGILSTDGVAAPVAAKDDDHADADNPEDDKKDDGDEQPNKPLQGPLDAIKDITNKDSAPVLTEQQDPKEAAMERPLAAQVVDGVKGAADAVPAAAQQQMAVDRHVNNDQALMAGTLEDPTASSTDTTSPKMATGIAQGQSVSDAYDAATTGDSDKGDDASLEPDADDGVDGTSGDGSDDHSDADLSSTDADAGDSDDGDDQGYFGELRSEFVPMEELTEDGLDHLKDAAESGAKAVKTLMSVPVSVLEREHRQVVFKMQELVGELMILAGKVFKKKY